MPVLDNPRHEKFAQFVADGLSDVAAYKKAFRCRQDAAESNASRMRENEGVSERITELQSNQAEKAEMTRDDLRKILVGMVLSKPVDASETNPLCELVMTKMGPAIVFPSKLGAAAQLAKLCGWNEPEKVDHGGEGIAQLLQLVRNGR